MTTEINSKIVGYRIKATEPQSAPVPAAPPDVNPLTLRIERRPEGALEAISEKITYYDNEGRHRIYIMVSFLPVDGVVNGEAVTIERPIEFFVPSGQLSSEHQWITATMRSLSLAARGGYITQALRDLRKVTWDKGPIRCGKNKWGKPVFHDSQVAMIAWSIQQILYRRGFLTEDGEQVPLEELIAGQADKVEEKAKQVDEAIAATAVSTPSGGTTQSAGPCSECGSDMQLMDGCPTCVTCGNSRCG